MPISKIKNLEIVSLADGFYMRIPKFYFKFDSNQIDISFEPKEGYAKHRAFDVSGNFYIPVYAGSLEGSKIVYKPNKEPAQMGPKDSRSNGSLNSIGINKAVDIIDYCLDAGGHCMTIFEVSAINMLEYFLYQSDSRKYYPVNGSSDYKKILPKTGTFKSPLGLYDIEATLWCYVTGLIRPADNSKYLMFKEGVNPEDVTSFKAYNDLSLYKEYHNDILANTMRYIEYRGPTDNFTTVDDCQMWLPSYNENFYKVQTLLTTDGVFSYHRSNMFVKVFGCYDAVEGKGSFTKDLFSYDEDNWYNSTFRMVRYEI